MAVSFPSYPPLDSHEDERGRTRTASSEASLRALFHSHLSSQKLRDSHPVKREAECLKAWRARKNTHNDIQERLRGAFCISTLALHFNAKLNTRTEPEKLV